jgi:hypothetical protein
MEQETKAGKYVQFAVATIRSASVVANTKISGIGIWNKIHKPLNSAVAVLGNVESKTQKSKKESKQKKREETLIT